MRTRIILLAMCAVGSVALAQGGLKTPVPPTRSMDGGTENMRVLSKNKGDRGVMLRELTKTVADAGAEISPLDGGKGSKTPPF